MKMLRFFCFFVLIIHFNVSGQETESSDSIIFKDRQKGFLHNEILKSAEGFQDQQNEDQPVKLLSLDFSLYEFPTLIDDYTKNWHQPPLSQGITGTCWCFATISFIESEVYRITGQELKLSEMYVVYWEYVERAREFVKQRGNVYFAEGSEATSVIRIMKMHGIVPQTLYPGKKKTQKFHDHREMFNEMNTYLKWVKENHYWNEEVVVNTIKDIMNHHMGWPPAKVIVRGFKMIPQDYISKVLQIDLNDYFSFMSTISQVYNQKGELIEPDNWWHCDDYYNVSIDDYISIINQAIQNDLSLCICGDVSEPGFDRYSEVGVIPAFDIPSAYIDENAREMRLQNNSTTDDHCMHLTGYYQDGDVMWYLVKDSGAGGFDGENKGYRFLHEDYIRLKMMNIMVHKEGATQVLNKIIK